MGSQLYVYAIPEHIARGLAGSKRQDIYEALLTWEEQLDDIDEELRENAEAWAEDADAILFPHPEIVEAVSAGHRLVMGDGEVEFNVLAVEGQREDGPSQGFRTLPGLLAEAGHPFPPRRRGPRVDQPGAAGQFSRRFTRSWRSSARARR